MSSETKYLNSSYQDFFEKSLSESDPDLFKAINDELIRQQITLNLSLQKILFHRQYWKHKVQF